MPKRYTKSQKDRIARKLHELISYVTIVTLHTTRMIVEKDVNPETREFEIETLNTIEATANTLYDDLNDEQHQFLRKLAGNILSEL